MVRIISAAAQAKLDQNLGTEPINIIEIQWVEGGSIYTYADKDLSVDEGKIITVGGLDNTVVVQGVSSGTSGDSQQISVTLDDTDGSIKDILDNNDIHKESAWVYQSFQGISTTDKFLIFKGQISSPIQWNEGDRTVTFDIITRIEDAEVGFSIEEGDFGFIADNLTGQSWPLTFGTVKLCKALKTRTPRVGTLKTGFGIRDFVLGPKLEQTGNACCALVFTGWSVVYEPNLSLTIKPRFDFDTVCECKKQALLCEYQLNIDAQSPFETNPIEIVNGVNFPQGQNITLDISGARISGSFNGTDEVPSNIFNISSRTHPKQVSGEISVPPIKNFNCFVLDPLKPINSVPPSNTPKRCIIEGDCTGYKPIQPRKPQFLESGANQVKATWDYLATFKLAGFFWAEPGSEITVVDDSEFVYIVNILPSTVHQVKAWRTFEKSNLRQLTTVPNTFYTVRITDYNGYMVTEVVLTQPLSARDEGWEDDLFVTHTSSIGPNPVDIMEWLIAKYTSFSWDGTFATVKTKVDNYPMHFMVPGRLNILTLLQEMCWQGRMAIVLRNDQFNLTYLSEEPNQDGDITESDVLANSLVLDHTNTEDLVTKFVAEWKPECNLEDPYKIILRYNVKRYGTNENTFDFYVYNIQELVLKSATFWLIRMANTWKKIICKTPVNKLALETLDGVFVTLNDIASEQIKCRIENATYNSADHSIDFVLQTPVRSGEMTSYPFHYPANISVEEIYPLIEDIQFGNAGGSGPNVNVKPPVGHALSNEISAPTIGVKKTDPCTDRFAIDSQTKDCGKDQGDRKPTDDDDVKPTVPLEDDNTAIPPGQSPLGEITDNEHAVEANEISQIGSDTDGAQGGTDNTNAGTGSGTGSGAGGGAGGGGGPAGGGNTGGGSAAEDAKKVLEELPEPDELDDLDICHFDLILFTAPVKTVRIPSGDTCDGNPCEAEIGWCYCGESGKTGAPVGNITQFTQETISYSSLSGLQAALADATKQASSIQSVGTTIVWFASSSSTPPPCEDQSNQSDIIGYTAPSGDSVIGVDGFVSGPPTGVPVDF